MRKRFFGQYLLSRGLLTAPQLLAAVEYQEKHNSRAGEWAVSLGMVTPFEAGQINALQVREDLRFGEAAVRLLVLTDNQVRDVLATQRDGHVLLGQAIETLGYMNRVALDVALADFARDAQSAPEGIVLPEGIDDPERTLVLFDLAHKLLLRAWNLANKPGPARIEQVRLLLSDRNARAELRGTTEASSLTVLVGVPHDAARKAAARAHEDLPQDTREDHAVLELAKVLAENLASALAERGETVEVERVVLQGARTTLPPKTQVLVVPYLTHLGQLLIGVGI